MRLSAFWGEVLAPAFHALAPGDPSIVAGRLRNAAVTTAFLAGLLPRYGPLGTGTVLDASIVPGAFVVAAVVAHQRRATARGDLEAVMAMVVAGVVPAVLSGGQGWWGIWLGVAAAFHAACSRVRADRVEIAVAAPDPDPLPRATRGVAVTTGRLAYVLATVLVFWSLVTQHMKVPTGSMQPTILGDHGGYGGDRLLADHMVYLFREPRRFDIVVFRYPLRRDILFVKRLVGLPGETVEIADGDIRVDGEVAVKPPLVQASLWQQLFPKKASAPTAKARKVQEAWGGVGVEDAGFRKAGDTALRLGPRSGDIALAPFRGRLSVPDLRVGYTAEPVAEEATAVLQITSRGRVVTLEVPRSAAGSGGLSIDGEERVAIDARLGAATRVELAVVDGVARAFVAGQEVAQAPLPAPSGRRNRAEIGGRGGELVLSSIRLDEDVYYRAMDGGLSKWEIPADRFVVLGDNSKNSEDSRLWRGRTFVVEGRAEPLLADDFSPDLSGGRLRNIVRKEGRVTFVDADGLPRDLAADAITSEEPRRPMPFVHRTDLIGRAALIFWPVPPFGSSFRPRLLP